jgi:hypothetical protein
LSLWSTGSLSSKLTGLKQALQDKNIDFSPNQRRLRISVVFWRIRWAPEIAGSLLGERQNFALNNKKQGNYSAGILAYFMHAHPGQSNQVKGCKSFQKRHLIID